MTIESMEKTLNDSREDLKADPEKIEVSKETLAAAVKEITDAKAAKKIVETATREVNQAKDALKLAIEASASTPDNFSPFAEELLNDLPTFYGIPVIVQ